jgi:hypothetical protein
MSLRESGAIEAIRRSRREPCWRSHTSFSFDEIILCAQDGPRDRISSFPKVARNDKWQLRQSLPGERMFRETTQVISTQQQNRKMGTVLFFPRRRLPEKLSGMKKNRTVPIFHVEAIVCSGKFLVF